MVICCLSVNSTEVRHLYNGGKMKSVIWPLLLAIGGGLLYHLSSKSVPKDLNPLIVTMGAYVTAFLVCLVAVTAFPIKSSIAESVKGFNWAVFGIGVGAAMIEIGFLLAYRAGSPISLASIIVNVSYALILIPIGLAFFHERITPWNGLGIVLCLTGLMLVTTDL